MKISTFICIFLLINSTLVFSQDDWRWISPYPHNNDIKGSCVINRSMYFWGEMETILSTHDAGKTFNFCARYADVDDVAMGIISWQRVSFNDSLTGIVLHRGVHRTTDGGETWNELFYSGYHFTVATFVDSKVGWMFGSSGSKKTINGGETWYNIWHPITETHRIYTRIYAFDEDRVWLLRRYNYYVQGDILFSEDGCNSWKRINIPEVQADSTTQVSYYDIKITESGLGIAVGTINYVNEKRKVSVILRTIDFGNNWEKTEIENINLNHIIKINNEHWLVFGNGTSYSGETVQLTSNDSAKSWQMDKNIFQSNYNYNYLQTINYLPQQKVILAATSAGIFKSTDLGNTFNELTNDTDIPIIDFSIDKTSNSLDQLTVAISDDECYLISEDGGRGWRLSLFPNDVGSNIKEVHIADGTIFLNVNGSEIYSSIDKGQSWNRIFREYGAGFRNLTARNKNLIAVIGYDNSKKIFYSIDGGSFWNTSPLSRKFWFNSFQLINPNTFVGCGGYYDSTSTNGMIYRSDDSGRSWRIIDYPCEMEHIFMFNKNTGFAHTHYDLYRTEDSGASWSTNLSSDDYYRYYSNFVFTDSLNGLMRVSYYFKKTENGGQSWETTNLNCPVWGGLKRMEYNNHGDLLVLGESRGFVIKISNSSSSNNQESNKEYSTTVEMMLEQNHPNPFNSNTIIRYNLTQKSKVSLKVYDILGREIQHVINQVQEPGLQEISFNGDNFPSGMYVYVLRTNGQVIARKMLLLR
jgi:photosystem II stability/assembly factor-like uncharacterized protein